MKLFSASIVTSWLTLSSLPFHVHAQDPNDHNITLRFFQNSQRNSCGYENSSNALTFTTNSVPINDYCFNFVDLFSGNQTQGFINQSRPYLYTDGPDPGIHWAIQNTDTFDPQGNYSTILYHQFYSNFEGHEEYETGHGASRKVTIYPGENCRDLSPDGVIKPWYGFSCWSKENGSCGTTGYPIASFALQAGARPGDKDIPCWEFSRSGLINAAAGLGSSWTVLGASLAAIMVVLFTG